MKVVLLEDVPKIGAKNQVKEVSDGYARNVLLRQKKAEIATPGAMRRAEEKQKHGAARREQERAQRNKVFEALDGAVVDVFVPATEQGSLFSKIDAKAVRRILSENSYTDLSGVQVAIMDGTIKHTGEHSITVSDNTNNVQFQLRVARKGEGRSV